MDIKKQLLKSRQLEESDLEAVRLYDPGMALFSLAEFLKEKFIVISDFDPDGLSAANIIKTYFPNIDIYIPTDSRGLQDVEYIKKIYENNPTNILALDLGTNAIEAEEYINSAGYKLFVIDHHKINTPVKNLINPWQDENDFQALCASSLIYCLLEDIYGYNSEAIIYAMIGTVADVVPVFFDNRYVIKNGLNEIAKKEDNRATRFLWNAGFYVTNERDIGFSVVPSLNSPRRLGMPEVAIDAYLYDDYDSTRELKALNDKRKQIVEDEILKANIYEFGNTVVVKTEAYPGISGLIAAKLVNKYHAPVMVICCDESGSIRSPMRGVATFIESCEFISGGGHAHAGGFSIHNKKDVPEILSQFDNYFRDVPTPEPLQPDLEMSVEDAIIDGTELEELAPFGYGFHRPVFGSDYVELIDNGKTKSGYKSVLIDGNKGMIWSKDDLDIPSECDIIYEIQYNNFRGKIYPFITLLGIK